METNEEQTGASPADSAPVDWRPIAHPVTTAEAGFLAGILEDAGIPVMIQGENIGAAMSGLAGVTPTVCVPRGLLNQAEAALAKAKAEAAGRKAVEDAGGGAPADESGGAAPPVPEEVEAPAPPRTPEEEEAYQETRRRRRLVGTVAVVGAFLAAICGYHYVNLDIQLWATVSFSLAFLLMVSGGIIFASGR